MIKLKASLFSTNVLSHKNERAAQVKQPNRTCYAKEEKKSFSFHSCRNGFRHSKESACASLPFMTPQDFRFDDIKTSHDNVGECENRKTHENISSRVTYKTFIDYLCTVETNFEGHF